MPRTGQGGGMTLIYLSVAEPIALLILATLLRLSQ
jgi:hypothetical protein